MSHTKDLKNLRLKLVYEKTKLQTEVLMINSRIIAINNEIIAINNQLQEDIESKTEEYLKNRNETENIAKQIITEMKI